MFVAAVHSFVDLVKYLFTIPDVKAFLSNKLCQDPLEKFFGQQRQRGRANENPNASEFLKNTQANGICRNVKGNCRGDNPNSKKTKSKRKMDPTLSEPLPKRRKMAK